MRRIGGGLECDNFIVELLRCVKSASPGSAGRTCDRLFTVDRVVVFAVDL